MRIRSNCHYCVWFCHESEYPRVPGSAILDDEEVQPIYNDTVSECAHLRDGLAFVISCAFFAVRKGSIFWWYDNYGRESDSCCESFAGKIFGA